MVKGWVYNRYQDTMDPPQPIFNYPLVDGGVDSCCPICLGDTDKQQVKQLACGHTYHPPCIEMWLHRNPTCPLCRIPLGARVNRPHSQIFPIDNSLQILPIRVLNRLVKIRGLYGQLHSGMERSYLESLLEATPPTSSELIQIALERHPRYRLQGLERRELIELL